MSVNISATTSVVVSLSHPTPYPTTTTLTINLSSDFVLSFPLASHLNSRDGTSQSRGRLKSTSPTSLERSPTNDSAQTRIKGGEESTPSELQLLLCCCCCCCIAVVVVLLLLQQQLLYRCSVCCAAAAVDLLLQQLLCCCREKMIFPAAAALFGIFWALQSFLKRCSAQNVPVHTAHNFVLYVPVLNAQSILTVQPYCQYWLCIMTGTAISVPVRNVQEFLYIPHRYSNHCTGEKFIYGQGVKRSFREALYS